MGKVSAPSAAEMNLGMAEIEARILKTKETLKGRLVVMGHFYQRDEIVRFADETGDSFALAKKAANTDAEMIVFCGVHFMAETADAVSRPDQKVYLPDPTAGCFLADCADIESVENAWQQLIANTDETIIPITYVNSAITLKSFCGRNGGLVCTSSNAQKALEWAWQRGQKVFFFPDQHLGRNTAWKMGIPLDEMILWDMDKPLGGHSPEKIQQAKVILWDGFCAVHQEFNVQALEKLRAEYPNITIIAHPECSFEVCSRADVTGSTSQIIKAVEEAPIGAVLGIGTERRLVNRLQDAHPDKKIFFIHSGQPECRTMSQTRAVHLMHQLEMLVKGEEVNRIQVDKKDQQEAVVAINRMLEL